MRHKRLKLSVILLLGFGLTGLLAQSMYVKRTNGTQTAYMLSDIRKLIFSGTGNMTVSKFNGSVDEYILTSTRYMIFSNVVTGINATVDDAKGIFLLYPNPVVDVLNIQLSITGNQIVTAELLTIEGKLLYKCQLISTTNTINLSAFPQGIYLCRVNNGSGIETTKFIKQ